MPGLSQQDKEIISLEGNMKNYFIAKSGERRWLSRGTLHSNAKLKARKKWGEGNKHVMITKCRTSVTPAKYVDSTCLSMPLC